MDVLHLFAQIARPARPTGRRAARRWPIRARMGFVAFDGGLVRDRPRRATASPSTTKARATEVWLRALPLADRLVTNGEWLAFIEDGGYAGPSSGSPTAGRACRRKAGTHPLYWERRAKPAAGAR